MTVGWIEERLKGRVPAWAVPIVLALVIDALPLILGLREAWRIFSAFAGRLSYPYDLEWMEGGMVAHAWRVREWLPLYAVPDRDWIPYIYPPGYPALLAGLSPVFGLGAPVGRAVSVLAIVAALGALVYGGWRHGKSAVAGLSGALVFLVCYPDSGAFYDLVRPDSLAVALLGWALVLGLEERRGMRIASGVLLALAFTVKHNAAAYGVAMALGIAVRFGVLEGVIFGVASAVPALAFTGILQGASGGHFLTTLLGIPGAHPLVGGRLAPGAIEELGKHLGIATFGAALALATGTVAWTRGVAWRVGVAVAGVVGAGVVVWAGLALPAAKRMPQPERWEETLAWAAIGVAVGVVPAAALAWSEKRWRIGALVAGCVAALVGAGLLSGTLVPAPSLPGGRAASGMVPISPVQLAQVACGLGLAGLSAVGLTGAAIRGRLDGRWLYGVGVALTALGTAGLMRAHHGGFLNVYIPLHFVIGLSVAVGLGLSRSRFPAIPTYALGALFVGAQLAVKSGFEPARYVPTQSDRAAGDGFVAALEQCEGPVLSPFNPWLPALAGHAPGFHLIALWDIDHREGPYRSRKQDIRAAADERYWDCVVEGSGKPLGFGIQENYRVWTVPEVPRETRPAGTPRVFMPRTGWRVRPMRILEPRD